MTLIAFKLLVCFGSLVFLYIFSEVLYAVKAINLESIKVLEKEELSKSVTTEFNLSSLQSKIKINRVLDFILSFNSFLVKAFLCSIIVLLISYLFFPSFN